MKAIVWTEILTDSILGNRIVNSGTNPLNIINYVYHIRAATSVFDSTDINGGNIDATIIGAVTPASIRGTAITATSSFDLYSAVTGTNLVQVRAGYINLFGSSSSVVDFHLSAVDASYHNPAGNYKFIFGGTSAATSGAFYEFKKKTAFIDAVVMSSTLTMGSRDVGSLLDIFSYMYTNGDASSWAAWTNFSAIKEQTGLNLANMNTTTINLAQWQYVAAMNQSVNSTTSPTFAAMTLASGDLNVTSGDIIATDASLSVNNTTLNAGLTERVHKASVDMSDWGWTGSVKSVAKLYDPYYALTDVETLPQSEIRTFDWWCALNKTGSEGSPSPGFVTLEELLGYEFIAGRKEAITFDLDSLFLWTDTGPVAIRYKLQRRWVRSTSGIYFVDTAGSGYVLDADGSYYSSSAPVGANSYVNLQIKEDVSNIPFLNIRLVGGFTNTWKIYISGRITIMNTRTVV